MRLWGFFRLTFHMGLEIFNNFEVFIRKTASVLLPFIEGCTVTLKMHSLYPLQTVFPNYIILYNIRILQRWQGLSWIFNFLKISNTCKVICCAPIPCCGYYKKSLQFFSRVNFLHKKVCSLFWQVMSFVCSTSNLLAICIQSFVVFGSLIHEVQ